MENEQKLTELIPLKVTKQMADELAAAAGGSRKRSDFIRRLIAAELDRVRSQTHIAQLCSRVAAAVERVPAIESKIEAIISTELRKRAAGR